MERALKKASICRPVNEVNAGAPFGIGALFGFRHPPSPPFLKPSSYRDRDERNSGSPEGRSASRRRSRLIGYWANGIDNVIFITRDPPEMSPAYPRSTAVFDIDSVAIIRYADTHLNSGPDFGGQLLGEHRDPRTHFIVGTGFEPEARIRTASSTRSTLAPTMS